MLGLLVKVSYKFMKNKVCRFSGEHFRTVLDSGNRVATPKRFLERLERGLWKGGRKGGSPCGGKGSVHEFGNSLSLRAIQKWKFL